MGEGCGLERGRWCGGLWVEEGVVVGCRRCGSRGFGILRGWEGDLLG